MFAVAVREADGLSGPLAEVIELCPPCSAAANRLDIDDARRMQRKDPFDTLVIDDSPDCECFIDSAASARDYSACKYLYTLFFALLDGATNIYGIADFKVRRFFLETFAFNSIEHLSFGDHRSFLFFCHIVSFTYSYPVWDTRRIVAVFVSRASTFLKFAVLCAFCDLEQFVTAFSQRV